MLKLGSVSVKFLLLVVFAGYSESYYHYYNHIPYRQASKQCPADAQEKWTYRGSNGPKYWRKKYPNCEGRMQSPIDIETSDVELNENLAPLQLENYYQPITRARIENNGHTIEVTPADGVERSITIDGDRYTLQQFHFHWGQTPVKGSEHTVDGISYALEMHLVHRNSNGAIAVVGLFFEEGRRANSELQKIVDEFPNVMYKDAEAEMSSSLNLNNLVPHNPVSYYRYQGSLTTPGCGEGVTWSVVPDALDVGKLQMSEFRQLYSAVEEDAMKGCRLAGNFRPVQPLNGRRVYISQ